MSSDFNRYRKNKQILEEGHLYSPKQEHDACGVGFVASVDGKQRREVVEGGIDALKLCGTEVLLMLMVRQGMVPAYLLKYL